MLQFVITSSGTTVPMPCNDCSANGDGSCACPVCLSIKLDDFTQLSWYRSLYSQPDSAILKTNKPPVDGQLPSLQANQLEAMTELEKVDQKIETIQYILSDAIAHRARLQKVVDDFHSALSPIRRVPFEIVRKILENIGTKDSASMQCKPDLNMTLYNGPWRFSTVCQLWRAVAIKSPEFWCDIHIDFRFNNRYKYRSSGLCALLDEGIRRSASRGLRVSLDEEDLDDDEDDEDDEDEDQDCGREKKDVLRALFARSSQIRTLEIKMQEAPELYDFLSSSSSTFTSLQCLSIELECYHNDDEGSDIVEAFKGSPFLVELKLKWLPVGKPFRYLNFPWNQLQIFDYAPSFSPDEVLDIIHLCPRLQRFTAYNTDTTLMGTPTAIHHAALTHLDLSFVSLSFLQHTTMPSLTILRVSIVDKTELTYLIQFISQSQCSIQELDFSLTDTSVLKYDTFLELLPSLTTLTLGLKSIYQLEEFQSALTPGRLPRLEMLKIEMPDSNSNPLAFCTQWSMFVLIRVIKSRPSDLQLFTFCSHSLLRKAATSTPKILHKKVKFLQGLLVPYKQKLKVWIEGGMELRLFHGTFPRFNLHANVVPVY
jgi:hypothetical protein